MVCDKYTIAGEGYPNFIIHIHCPRMFAGQAFLRK